MGDAVDYITLDLPELLRLIQASDVRELEVREGGMRVRLHRSPLEEGLETDVEPPELQSLPVFEPQVVEVTAPIVGTFYRAAEPETPPLVDEGSRVEERTVVGIIEALNVLNPVEAATDGVVTKVLATDGQPVEYGQALFEVSPSG